MSKRKHAPAPAKPVEQPPLTATAVDPPIPFDPPIVAEAATDVTCEENVSTSEPTTSTGPGSAGWPPTEEAAAADERPIDWASCRISAGKLIAKHLRIPPAAAQQQAAGLTESQVTRILACQLDSEPAARMHDILG